MKSGLFLAAFVAACVSACAVTRSNPGHSANSFLGVSFGDSIKTAEQILPAGRNEASPLGLPSYRVNQIGAGGVNYQSVIYEFTALDGMQLVMVRFAPDSATGVLRHLQDTLGPSAYGNRRLIRGPYGTAEIAWHMPDGSKAEFRGADGELVLIGPHGSYLEPEIQMRQESGVD
jgi:hypothetical protein